MCYPQPVQRNAARGLARASPKTLRCVSVADRSILPRTVRSAGEAVFAAEDLAIAKTQAESQFNATPAKRPNSCANWVAARACLHAHVSVN